MTKEKKLHKQHKKLDNAIIYVVLILISIIWLFPFFCIVMQSLHPLSEGGGISGNILPTSHFSFENYKYLFTASPEFLGWYKNTFIIAFFVAIGQTCMVLMVSYALSRMRFKGRNFIMRFWLILGMFPGFLSMICLYFLLKQFGLTQDGAVPGLILIGVASSGMGYYVCKGYFDTIPKSLDEAARIDGATRSRIFFTMICPLAKPMIIYTALTAFMAPWNDYIFASYVAFGKSSKYNVAVGLFQWINNNDYQGFFTRFCAGGVTVAIPVTILFLLLQKYYVEGVTGGAVKG